MQIVRLAIVALLLTAAAGCSKKGLHDLRSNDEGPEEFMVLPSKPLSEPTSYKDLPAPTPGAGNITDPTPNADAIAALGGRPSSLNASGIPSADAALVAQGARYGSSPDIREQLAAADEQFRRRARRSGRIRLFPVDRYAQAYRRDKIEPFREQRRWQRAGAITPSAPPENN